MNIDIHLHGSTYQTKVIFTKYIVNNHTGLVLQDIEDTDSDLQGMFFGSVNADDDILNNPDFIALNEADNIGLTDELIRHGLIESLPTQFARLNHNFGRVPIHRLTPKGIEVRDECFEKHRTGITV